MPAAALQEDFFLFLRKYFPDNLQKQGSGLVRQNCGKPGKNHLKRQHLQSKFHGACVFLNGSDGCRAGHIEQAENHHAVGVQGAEAKFCQIAGQ